MNIYQETDYKPFIKGRTKAEGLTLRKIASRIPIQYTYLSKALNDEATHLNEDHLYSVGNILRLYPEEVDYLLLLRAEATARHPQRKQALQGKLKGIRRERSLNAEVRPWDGEMSYLLDPLCVLVHVSMDIEAFRDNPNRLCGVLGISREKLKQVLATLKERNLEKGEAHIHFGTDHPLMRVHQNLIGAFEALPHI